MKTRISTPAVLVAIVAGLALADSSVVALALPPIRVDLNASIYGLAGVIGAYVIVLGLALYPAAVVSRHFGAARTGMVGFAVLGIASIGCALADSLHVLLLFRGLQAVGGAAGVLAAFDLLDPGDKEGNEERHLWIAAAVFGTAAGPAVGGLLTQAFDWRSIFWIQVPIGIVGAIACMRISIPQPTHHASPFKWRPLVSLGLLAGGLAAVLFTLVLQLVAGWHVEPIVGALTVSVLPVTAIVAYRNNKIPEGPRAALGCLMVGLGTLCLIFVPGAGVLWTVPAQALAGIGMGLALPALNGGLVPEKTTADAARLLTARHIGIFLALVVIAALVRPALNESSRTGEQQVLAALLDSDVSPGTKISLLTSLKDVVDSDSPRGKLQETLDSKAKGLGGKDRVAFAAFQSRADDAFVAAVNKAFRWAYIVAGLMALIAALLVSDSLYLGAFSRFRLPAVGAGLVVLALYFGVHAALAPKPVKLADPCQTRKLPESSGFIGAIQTQLLQSLDKTACANGSSREELLIALGGGSAAEDYRAKFGHDPGDLTSFLARSGLSGLSSLLKGFLGG